MAVPMLLLGVVFLALAALVEKGERDWMTETGERFSGPAYFLVALCAIVGAVLTYGGASQLI